MNMFIGLSLKTQMYIIINYISYESILLLQHKEGKQRYNLITFTSAKLKNKIKY